MLESGNSDFEFSQDARLSITGVRCRIYYSRLDRSVNDGLRSTVDFLLYQQKTASNH